MTPFYILAAALCALAIALLVRPLWWPFGSASHAALTDEVAALALQLRQLKALQSAGALPEEQYTQSKGLVERKLLAALSVPSSAAEAGQSRVRPSLALSAAMAVFALVVAGAGYRWLGSPESLGTGPGTTTAATVAGDAPTMQDPGAGVAHELKPEQVAAMIEQLAERLKAHPDDADGWQMLARSNVAIGQHAQAVDAFKQALRLRPDDANLLADYADALAMTQKRSLEGEPGKLIERALKTDPRNAKALALAGTAAFNRQDYKKAVQYWETIDQTESMAGTSTEQIQASISEARQLAGMPAPAATRVADKSVTPGLASVSGTVTLAPALAARVAPSDTLFVFARAEEGSRMPLAILRKQVRDLPLRFTLDDSMAMSEQTKLSSVSRVIVGARISKSGNAMPQAGDLQVTTPAVTVGVSGLELAIDQVVTK